MVSAIGYVVLKDFISHVMPMEKVRHGRGGSDVEVVKVVLMATRKDEGKANRIITGGRGRQAVLQALGLGPIRVAIRIKLPAKSGDGSVKAHH